MGDLVSVPLWLFLAISAFALWSLVDRLVIPSGRWFLRRRLNRLIDTVNRKLDVEIKPFQLTKRQVLIDRLVYDPQVVAAANDYARESKIPREAAMNEVYRYAREIVPTFNAYLYFRLGYSIARLIARLLYRVRLGYADEKTLAGVPAGTAVVFVMNHRSNMDYVLVAFLAAERTALSYAVGEWARIWPLQQLIRSMGAYFVRRNSNNPVYRRVLERYVHMATEAGVAQAMYPEGGLSRDGRLVRVLEPGRHVLFDPARALQAEIRTVVDAEMPAERFATIRRSISGSSSSSGSHSAGVPAPIVKKLNTEINSIMQLPETAKTPVVQKLDPSLLEAAEDLGASRWRTFVRVTLPISMPGVGTPRSPESTSGRVTKMANGPDSVMPKPVLMTMRSPISASAEAYRLSQIGCASAAPA